MAKILIVDDDKEVLESLALSFEGRGYQVIQAEDGVRGLALAEREAPDVMIVDMMMPGQSGFAVVENIKRPHGPSPRVVIITANTDPRHRRHAEEIGVDGYFCKPFDVGGLVEFVQRLVSP